MESEVEGRCAEREPDGLWVEVEVRGALISTDSGAGVEEPGLFMLNRPKCRKTDLRLGLTVASASAGTAGSSSVAVLVDGCAVCSVGKFTWLVDMASVYDGTWWG